MLRLRPLSRRHLPFFSAALVALLCTACATGDGTGEPDSEPAAEPSVSPEAGEPEAGEPEAGEPEAGEPEAGEPEAGEPDPAPACNAGDFFGVCDGADAIEVCNDGSWGSYSCDTLCQQQGEAGGSCGPAGGSDDCLCESGPAEPVHGSLCDSNDSSACGFPSSGLLCVVENQGDVQGTCRVVCNTFLECTDNDEALNAFDTECCDVFNGSRVCANDSVYPDACAR